MDRTKLEPEMILLLKRLRRFALIAFLVAVVTGTFFVLMPRRDLLLLPRWVSAGIVMVLGLSIFFLLVYFPIMYSTYKQLGSARGQLRDQLSARRRLRS